MIRGRTAMLAMLGVVTLTLTGCGFDGLNSMPAPFSAGSGSDAYQVTVEVEQLGNLVPNAEVKVRDLTVGTVRKVEFDNWHARLTIGLENSVTLPANAEARVAQKSLLGAEYLDLTPPTSHPAKGALHEGSVIPLSQTGHYPETEDLLATLSMVLNGGGLGQLQTISTELNHALAGHEQDVRGVLSDLRTLVGTVNSQRDRIVSTIDGLDRFSGALAQQNKQLASSIDALGPGFQSLAEERPALTGTLQAASNLSAVATRVINETQENLLANLRQLQPVLSQLANSGNDLPQSLSAAGTILFPLNTLDRMFKGDYGNLFATFDISLPTLDRYMLTGTPLQGGPTRLAQTLAQLVNPGSPESPGILSNLYPPNASLVGPTTPPGPDNPNKPAPAPTGGSGPPPSGPTCPQPSGMVGTLLGQGGC